MGLSLNQIYNADETGLYWKLLPDKTYVPLTEKTAPGVKTEKQRITFLACANATGLHKLKPSVIGKARNPRCFKNFTLPVDYTNSPNAWMTAEIFRSWFHRMFVPQVTKFLKSEDQPVAALFLLDNAPSHPPEEDLRSEDGSIITMYMPPNVTPLIQPIDQNAIRITKLYYRKFLLSSILCNKPEKISEVLKKLTLKDAVTNLHLAWDSLEEKTIEKCWTNILSQDNNDPDDDIPLNILKEQWNCNTVDKTVSEIKELLNSINPEVQCTNNDIDQWNEDKLLQDDKNTDYTSKGSEDEEDLNEETLKDPVSHKEAVEAFNKIIDWAEENGINYSDFLVLSKLRSIAFEKSQKKLKQTKLTSYFSK